MCGKSGTGTVWCGNSIDSRAPAMKLRRGLALPLLLLQSIVCPAYSDEGDSPQVNTTHKYCVIGGGPAGLQMGYFLKKAKEDYVILERASRAGHFFEQYPRHRTIISINKRYAPLTIQKGDSARTHTKNSTPRTI